MSELKAHKIGDLCFDFKMGKDVGIDFYLKSEADKVIAEKNKLIAYAQALVLEDIKLIHHHKYKRCLAMAKWCESENYTSCWYHENSERCEWTEKWLKRWLELAKKFKEVK